MPEAIFKFGADERNSMRAIAGQRWETQLKLILARWRCSIEFQTMIKNVT
jgi:hypothetical protein